MTLRMYSNKINGYALFCTMNMLMFKIKTLSIWTHSGCQVLLEVERTSRFKKITLESVG